MHLWMTLNSRCLNPSPEHRYNLEGVRKSNRMNRNIHFKTWSLYVLLWLLLAVCFSSQAYLEYEIRGNQASWPAMFAWEGPAWALWGLLTIAIFRLTQRFPLDRKHWLRYLPIYLAAAVLCAPIHLILHVFFNRMLYPAYGTLAEALQINFFSRITWRIFVFAILALACHGWGAQRRFRNEERKATDLHVQLVQAQLEALKMQMHPHFLFNTLHSLSELIHRDTRAAEEVIVRLADFLRLSLRDPGQQEVPLRKEVEFLQCYLEIEKVRLQDRLQIVMEIEPALLDIPVPHFILQPLVENAVRHGIAPRSGPGKVEIRASQSDSELRIEVIDNGAGLSTTADSCFQKGLGLSNTRARLEKMYGPGSHLQLRNHPQGGMVATLNIPLRNETESPS